MELSSLTISRIFAAVAVVFGIIAIILASVGLGTPEWQSTYTHTTGSAQLASTNNFFYACSYSSGSLVACASRGSSFTYYASSTNYLNGLLSKANDTSSRFDSASGLSIVGIILIGFGTVSTFLMIFLSKFIVIVILAPILFFLATLFMLAGLAEGSRVLIFNGYSANLYETGHMLTILGFGLCCVAAARFQALKSV